MSQDPNEVWATPQNFLDPFFETRDHANHWDTRVLWLDDVSKPSDEESSQSSSEKSAH